LGYLKPISSAFSGSRLYDVPFPSHFLWDLVLTKADGSFDSAFGLAQDDKVIFDLGLRIEISTAFGLAMTLPTVLAARRVRVGRRRFLSFCGISGLNVCRL